VPDEKTAREVSEKRSRQQRLDSLMQQTRPLTLEDMFSHINAGKVKELRLILKADVRGSLEAIRQSLTTLNTADVQIKMLHEGTGGIGESDVSLAVASGAIIIGFNVRPEKKAETEAEKAGVDIRLYTVIYNITDDIRKAMEGLLEPTLKEVNRGRAEVRNTFQVPKVGIVAGCYVTEGTIPRSAGVRLLRDNRVVYEGKISSLRRFKDDVSEVKTGFECGIGLERYQDIKVGDVIEAFSTEKVAGVLSA